MSNTTGLSVHTSPPSWLIGGAPPHPVMSQSPYCGTWTHHHHSSFHVRLCTSRRQEMRLPPSVAHRMAQNLSVMHSFITAEHIRARPTHHPLERVLFPFSHTLPSSTSMGGDGTTHLEYSHLSGLLGAPRSGPPSLPGPVGGYGVTWWIVNYPVFPSSVISPTDTEQHKGGQGT